MNDKFAKAVLSATKGNKDIIRELSFLVNDPDHFEKEHEINRAAAEAISSDVSMDQAKKNNLLSALMRKTEATINLMVIMHVVSTYEQNKEIQKEKSLSKAAEKMYKMMLEEDPRLRPLVNIFFTKKYVKNIIKPIFIATHKGK